MISIVIPTCDRPGELIATLRALTRQTRPPEAVVVVDNGIDPVRIPELPLPLHILRAPVRCGAAQARNLGAACATTDWIAFLDDDDRWSPDYLEYLHADIAADPRATVHLARLQIVDPAGTVRDEKCYTPETARALLYRNPGITGSNLAVHRAAWARAGGYDPCLPASEDTAFGWALLDAGERIAVEPRRIAYARIHDAPRLSDGPNWLSGKLRFWWSHRRQLRPREHGATLATIAAGLWRRMLGQP